MKILGDKAIQHKDEDALGRVEFAEHIAEGILNWKSKENLCIALHGSWGSGKTSIINLCIESIKEKTKELQQEDRPIIIHFQPWLISGHEQLIKSFLKQLRIALGRPGLSEYAKEASKQLETFENLLGYATWIPKAGGFVKKVGDVISKLRGSAEMISKQLDEDLESNKEAICNALSKLKSPVIVIIDDVDRLTSDEIRQLFQLIKAVADFPNTVYFLAFDHTLVEKALEPFQSGSETRYLEKIVQLDFEVPYPGQSQIAAVLWDGLEDIVKTISSEETEQDRWNEIRFGLLPSIFRNIRDIKRYLNAVNFKFPIIKGEVSTVDLLSLEAMRIFSPYLYKAVRDNKEYLVSDSYMGSLDSDSKDEKIAFIKNLPQLVPEYCRRQMGVMLEYLFPEVESVLHNRGWGGEFLEIWDRSQRICMSTYFDYYYRGTLPEGAVSAKEVRRVIGLLNDQKSLILLLRNYMLDGRILKLLTKIEYSFSLNNHIDRNKIQNIIIAIFSSGENLPLKPDDILDIPTDWKVQASAYRLIKLLDKGVRKDVLLNAIKLSENVIVFPVALASYVWKEWNPTNGEESKKSDEDKLLTKEDADATKDAALELIRKHKDTDVLYKSRHLLSTLYYWERWSNIGEVKKWINSILSDEKKIPEFLGGCGGFISTAGMNSHYVTHKFKIKPSSLEKYCNIHQLKEKCEGLLESKPEWLNDDYKNIIRGISGWFQ